jgi:N-acetylneuraminate synthase
VNHNGSLESAKRLVAEAARAGADAIKFQTFKAELLATEKAEKAAYQKKNDGAEGSQLEMLKKLELSQEHHHVLRACAKENGIDFLSTPFDFESLDFLTRELDLPRIKIASGDLVNAPFLLKAARTGKKLILSSGMATLSDIETALGVVAFGYLEAHDKPSLAGFEKAYFSERGQAALREKVVLLHCTSAYPTPPEDIHLSVMQTYRSAFPSPIGLSDHSEGIAIPVAATALGAVLIEKHITLDRNLPGPDHRASIVPDELAQMVRMVRDTEKALGKSQKIPAPQELLTRAVARKSLVVSRPVRKGEILDESVLALKRPGTGLPPLRYWDALGTPAKRDFGRDEMVEL